MLCPNWTLPYKLKFSTTHYDQSSCHIHFCMIAIGPTATEELCSKSISILKIHENVKTPYNSYKYCQIRVVGKYYQLHIMNN